MIAYHDAEWGVPQHDDRVLFEFLILEGALGADVAFATDRLRREASGCRGGFEEAHGPGIDAEKIGGGILNEGFGIDCAGEMHVEIGPLWHAGEKGGEFRWALSRGVEGTDGTLLAWSRG